MSEKKGVKAFLVVSSLLGAGVLAAMAPASAQGRGGGSTGSTIGTGNSNTVANLLIPMAAVAYGAYWLAAGVHYGWITVPHRVGHPYAIPPKRSAREESESMVETGAGAVEESGEKK